MNYGISNGYTSKSKRTAMREAFDISMCEFLSRYEDGTVVTFCMKERMNLRENGEWEGYCGITIYDYPRLNETESK